MSVRISLTLEASEMFLSLHIIFSLERTAVVWAILERISGFDPSLEMIAPKYLKFSNSSSLCLFILISLCLVWTDFHFVPCCGFIKTVYQDATSSSSSAFTTMSSAKRKLVMSHPPMLTLPLWSSKASQMILSGKMFKRIGESRHHCRTPTIFLNHSSVLPLHSGPCHTNFQWLV